MIKNTIPKQSTSLLPKLFSFIKSPESTIKATPKNTWEETIYQSEKLVQVNGSIINTRELLGSDLELITDNIKRLLGSGHPVLNTISHHYFSQKGKHIRPLIVLLMSKAIQRPYSNYTEEESIDDSLLARSEIHFGKNDFRNTDSTIVPCQRRLAEITELIHTASLLHDDVIDAALTRRSKPSPNATHGNKMAILAGDFLLARASVALARLRNVQVVELLATVISNLVEGEFMQLRNSGKQRKSHSERFEYYMEKNYKKTASLIAKSCEASAVLAETSSQIQEAAYRYGKCLGMAFQVVDDVLDFVVSADSFGKPVNADLKLGIATAPVLYAAQEYPELYPLMDREFSEKGDVETALELVLKSQGLHSSKLLAKSLCDEAVEAISIFPQSEAKDALIQLTQTLLNRNK